jgi:hypothetical protein
MPLPPGQAPARDWVPVGSRPATPTVDPQRPGAAGNTGEAGVGGASWQLRVPPRHRAVLQRYFGPGGLK